MRNGVFRSRHWNRLSADGFYPLQSFGRSEEDDVARFHVPPRMSGVSQMFCGGPPDACTFLSFPPAKNAIERLSGDQNRLPAPSVPGSSAADSVSIGRTNKNVVAASRAEYATTRPSAKSQPLQVPAYPASE